MQILDGFVIGAVTLLAVVAGLMVLGIAIVSRRGARPVAAVDAVRRSAGSSLVRADDRVAEAETDIDFAMAQFGERATEDYRAALTRARIDRDEVFRLHRMLEQEPGAGLRHRERADRIVMLAERIERTLDEQSAQFRDRRALETGAPERLERLIDGIAAARERLAEATRQRDSLLAEHARTALGPAVDAPERAARGIDRAGSLAAQATPGTVAPASSVMATIAEAERLLFSAEETVGQVAAAAQRLEDAVDALQRLRDDARGARAEALAAAAAAPDGDSGAAITAAVAQLDRAAANRDAAGDPLDHLADLGEAMSAVEVALASSRTQAQRLAHAREAYLATRVQAEAQLVAARGAVGSGGSAGARARLEDAVDELRASQSMIDTDPVGALDAVRRALTHARDAEVLARY